MKTVGFLLFVSAILVPGLATAEIGVPSLDLSTATVLGGTGEILTLMVVPDAGGPDFSGARDPYGNPADATIQVFLADPSGMAIPGYPREDIWLDWDPAPDAITACTPGRWDDRTFDTIHLDVEMDAQGISHFSLPPHAGGYAEGPVYVVISGDRLRSNAGLALRFNSPDITGDGRVNLSDVVPFAQDYYGDYHFRSDLEHDGVVNLSDVAKIAQHLGAGCP
jgi:hypothetical protein